MTDVTTDSATVPTAAEGSLLAMLLRARGSSIDDADVFEFLRELGAPPNLKGIIGVAARLLKMLDNGLLRGAAGTEKRLGIWRDIAHAIVERSADIERALPDVVPPAGAKFLYGVITESPVYAALWHSARLADETAGFDERFLTLQAQLLLWFITVGHDAESKHAMPFGRVVRVLSEATELARAVLSGLPAEIESDRQYLALVSALKDTLRGNKAAWELLRAIEQLMRSLMGLQELIARPHRGSDAAMGGASVRGDRRRRGDGQEMPVGDDDGDVLVTRAKRNTPSGKTKTSGGDDTNPVGIVARCHGRHPFDSGCYSRGAYEVRVRHMQAAIDRGHNTCHAEFNQADPNSIQLLIEALSRCDASRSDWQVELALGLILFSARGVEAIAPISIDCESSVVPAEPMSPCIYLKPRRIVLDAPTAVAFRARHDPSAPSRATVNFVVLALPDCIERICKRRLELLRQDTSVRTVRAFESKVKMLERGVKDYLRSFASNAGESLGLGKLRRYVFNRLRHHERGGHVAASVICDRVSPMSKNPLAYRWTSLKALLTVHAELVSELENGKT